MSLMGSIVLKNAIAKALIDGYKNYGEIMEMDLVGFFESNKNATQEEIDEEIQRAIRIYHRDSAANAVFLADQLLKAGPKYREIIWSDEPPAYIDEEFVTNYEMDGHTLFMALSDAITGNPTKAKEKLKEVERCDITCMVNAIEKVIDAGYLTSYPKDIRIIAEKYGYKLVE